MVETSPEGSSAASFRDDVPMAGAGAALLQLLAQGDELEAGEEVEERRGVAVEMRMAFGPDPVDNEGIGGDRSTKAVIRVAGREDRAVEEPARVQDAPDLAEPAADIAQRAVMDNIPRERVIEALIQKRQRSSHALRPAPPQAAGPCPLAPH